MVPPLLHHREVVVELTDVVGELSFSDPSDPSDPSASRC